MVQLPTPSRSSKAEKPRSRPPRAAQPWDSPGGSRPRPPSASQIFGSPQDPFASKKCLMRTPTRPAEVSCTDSSASTAGTQGSLVLASLGAGVDDRVTPPVPARATADAAVQTHGRRLPGARRRRVLGGLSSLWMVLLRAVVVQALCLPWLPEIQRSQDLYQDVFSWAQALLEKQEVPIARPTDEAAGPRPEAPRLSTAEGDGNAGLPRLAGQLLMVTVATAGRRVIGCS
eukprot:CAMPEP_0115141816 /NCGR_PEP_ID=MMETSP0227-20121206/59783_1 /TAXON_ID=89957 /ORGANISM="Polarella glacialis, Strain CCMP 1383" /LENGTH=229 /DNA_ID=CAMNT_0002550291 /DNA_START=160 /DNA_END=849 /DNA_ORIENTATION=+